MKGSVENELLQELVFGSLGKLVTQEPVQYTSSSSQLSSQLKGGRESLRILSRESFGCALYMDSISSLHKGLVTMLANEIKTYGGGGVITTAERLTEVL